jgi:hypothetical protein
MVIPNEVEEVTLSHSIHNKMLIWTRPNVDATVFKKGRKFPVRGNSRLPNHGPEEAFVSKLKLNSFTAEDFGAHEGSDTYISKCYYRSLQSTSHSMRYECDGEEGTPSAPTIRSPITVEPSSKVRLASFASRTVTFLPKAIDAPALIVALYKIRCKSARWSTHALGVQMTPLDLSVFISPL